MEFPPPWRKKAKTSGGAPQDYGKCAVGCYLWGKQTSIVLDCLVLGYSLSTHNTKPARVICCNDDTLEMNACALLAAFWDIIPVSHAKVPDHLQGSELARLRGVYSKMQCWKLFKRKGPHQYNRFLLMDGDMLVRVNIDDIFATSVPAGVMRGEADTCLYEKRPPSTFFQRGDPRSFTHQGMKMKGGINGGLVLFSPDEPTYDKMMKELAHFRPVTEMAEQEFLSYYFGKSGSFWGIHKKYNFQIHQLYLTGAGKPPMGQRTPSSYHTMIHNPGEVKTWHFSADVKPSNVLLNMDSKSGWFYVEETLEQNEMHMRKQQTNRMDEDLAANVEELEAIKNCNMTAHREWLEAWKGTWQSLCLFVVNSAVKDHLELDGYDCYICTVCGDELPEHRIIYHFLINCPAMRKTVHLPLFHMFDLRALLHVPCGRLAESKLYYLGEILAFFKSKKGFVTHEPPKISLDMTGLLEIDGEPFIKESKLDTIDPALCKGS